VLKAVAAFARKNAEQRTWRFRWHLVAAGCWCRLRQQKWLRVRRWHCSCHCTPTCTALLPWTNTPLRRPPSAPLTVSVYRLACSRESAPVCLDTANHHRF